MNSFLCQQSSISPSFTFFDERPPCNCDWRIKIKRCNTKSDVELLYQQNKKINIPAKASHK